MNLMEKYNEAENNIFKHVGFEPSWVVLPIEDMTDMYWREDGDIVCYANTEKELCEEAGNYYEDEVYKISHYDKWIYRGNDFTMIFCDPQTDGIQWFKIFDNKKEIKTKQNEI